MRISAMFYQETTAICLFILIILYKSTYLAFADERSQILRQFTLPTADDSNCSLTQNIPSSELQALRDLYDSTEGDDWNWLPINSTNGVPWNFSGTPNPCDPKWQGLECYTFPNINETIHIVVLSLPAFNLVGALPQSVFNLTQLVTVCLSDNNLHGSVPSTIGQLSALQSFEGKRNGFTGTLPAELGACTALAQLDLSFNAFHGTLPRTWGYLKQLNTLALTMNHLTGSIPTWVGNLTTLQYIHLDFNHFRGTLSDAVLSSLSNLQELSLRVNALSGTLPASLVALSSLAYLNLAYNELSGTIPAFLFSMTTLQQMTLCYNALSGSLRINSPATANSTSGGSPLNFLDVHQNLLTGQLPAALSASLPELFYLYLSDNDFTGTLPAQLCQLPLLAELQLTSNYLTGTINACLGSVDSLQALIVGDNRLTGTIPYSLGNLSSLTTLYLYQNYLRGPLPSALSNAPALAFIYVYVNFLSGPLPTSLANLTSLQSLFVQRNALSGSLEGVFGGAGQPYLSTIELDGNKLTGALPSSMLRLPALRTLVLVGNCLHNTVPISLCNVTTFATLALDGLHAAPRCRDVLLPGLSNSYATPAGTNHGSGSDSGGGNSGGSIPACLFAMPRLNTLHLSGNGLTGTLPDVSMLPAALVDVVLAHNQLIGTLPRAFQQRRWFHLDLSYNKLSGVLRADFGSVALNRSFLIAPPVSVDALPVLPIDVRDNKTFGISESLSLRNNRLSDRVPATLKHRRSLSVLEGNLFGCRVDRRDLPPHDSGRRTYQCGSDAFDLPFFAWLGLMFAVSALLVAAWIFPRANNSVVTSEFTSAPAQLYSLLHRLHHWVTQAERCAHEDCVSHCRPHNVAHFSRVLDGISAVAVSLAVLVLVFMLPAYVAASAWYATHTREYAWTVSAAFLSGYPVLGVLLGAFSVFLVLAAVLAVRVRKVFLLPAEQACTNDLDPDNFIISFQQEHEATAAFATEIATALQAPRTARTVENLESRMHPLQEQQQVTTRSSRSPLDHKRVALLYTTFFLANIAVVLGANIAYVYVAIYQDRAYVVLAQLALSVFKVGWNSVIAVKLVHLLKQRLGPGNASTYLNFLTLQLFVSLLNVVAVPCLVVGIISPNCFNNLLVAEPEVVSRFLFSECAVMDPVTELCARYVPGTSTTTYRPPFTYSYQCSASFITYYAPSFLYMALIVTFINPGIAVLAHYVHRRFSHQKTSWFARRLDRWVPLILHEIKPSPSSPSEAGEAENETAHSTGSLSAVAASNNTYSYRPYVDTDSVLVNLLTYLGVLMTFGLTFPPLAVALAVSICVAVLSVKARVGWFLSTALEHKLWVYVDCVEQECRTANRSVGKFITRSAAMLLTCAGTFFSLFLFDAVGDDVGAVEAVWVLPVISLLPSLLLLLVVYALKSTSVAATMAAVAGRRMDPPWDDGNAVQSERRSGGSSTVELREVVVNPIPVKVVCTTESDAGPPT